MSRDSTSFWIDLGGPDWQKAGAVQTDVMDIRYRPSISDSEHVNPPHTWCPPRATHSRCCRKTPSLLDSGKPLAPSTRDCAAVRTIWRWLSGS